MTDPIERQAAIDIANGYCHPANIAKELAKLPSVQQCKYWDTESNVCALHRPSAQTEPHWIPCNERLPKDNGNYLVTYIYKDEKGTEEPYVIADIFMTWKGAFATEEPTDKAQAWMPLPEPYTERGGQDEQENNISG